MRVVESIDILARSCDQDVNGLNRASRRPGVVRPLSPLGVKSLPAASVWQTTSSAARAEERAAGASHPRRVAPKPVRCNPNEDTDGKFIPAEHIVQFVDKAAYTLRGSFSRHHRETIELDSIDED